jgi:hypothetical protein
MPPQGEVPQRGTIPLVELSVTFSAWYRATNVELYPFEWVDLKATELDYGAILMRISREYTRRFANGRALDQ